MASVSETYIENRERIQPNDTNSYGAAHGGNIMRWMDEVGAMSAMRAAGQPCVTAHVNDLEFRQPIPEGETAVIRAYAYASGRTSIRVRLQAFHEDPQTGDRQQTTDSYFVFVAIDKDGDPTAVPDLTTDSDRCERLRDEALDGEVRE